MAAFDIRQLEAIYNHLSDEGRRALLDYAEYLKDRYPEKNSKPAQPVEIERPEEESVVLAIRRLSNTYPMLDRQALLHDTASFMMQHMVQGREAREIIDELEVYFRQQYESLMARLDNV